MLKKQLFRTPYESCMIRTAVPGSSDLIDLSSLTGLLDLIAQSGYLIPELISKGEILLLACSLSLLSQLQHL